LVNTDRSALRFTATAWLPSPKSLERDRFVAVKSCPLTKTVALPEVPNPPAELWLFTITVLLADEPRPCKVM
jgi:hypothetical protein